MTAEERNVNVCLAVKATRRVRSGAEGPHSGGIQHDQRKERPTFRRRHNCYCSVTLKRVRTQHENTQKRDREARFLRGGRNVARTQRYPLLLLGRPDWSRRTPRASRLVGARTTCSISKFFGKLICDLIAKENSRLPGLYHEICVRFLEKLNLSPTIHIDKQPQNRRTDFEKRQIDSE